MTVPELISGQYWIHKNGTPCVVPETVKVAAVGDTYVCDHGATVTVMDIQYPTPLSPIPAASQLPPMTQPFSPVYTQYGLEIWTPADKGYEIVHPLTQETAEMIQKQCENLFSHCGLESRVVTRTHSPWSPMEES